MFSKKPKVADSSRLALAADSAVNAFQTAISQLTSVADEADQVRAEKQKEIEKLQAEANSLDDVAKNARSWASKIGNLFKTDAEHED